MYVKALQLIVFMLDDEQPKTLLNDWLYYSPGYRTGDVIHLVRPPHPARQSGDDRQYVVLNVEHVVSYDDASSEPNHHVMLVEVAELAEAERSDFNASLYALMK